MRAVTRNINFPVGDIFHSRSKEPLPQRIAVASLINTTTLNINTFSKDIKASNLHIPEEHVPLDTLRRGATTATLAVTD